MCRRIFGYAFEKWKTSFKDWKKDTLSFFATVLSFLFIYFLIGENEARLEIRLFVYFLGCAIILQIIYYLLLLHLAPFMILKEQDGVIAAFKKIADRKSIILKLTELRTEGIALRNRGEGLMHQSSVEQWWKEHIEWKDKTKATMALLDPIKANEWERLDLYTPRRDFPRALNALHRSRLQWFDGWLERLLEKIKELQDYPSTGIEP